MCPVPSRKRHLLMRHMYTTPRNTNLSSSSNARLLKLLLQYIGPKWSTPIAGNTLSSFNLLAGKAGLLGYAYGLLLRYLHNIHRCKTYFAKLLLLVTQYCDWYSASVSLILLCFTRWWQSHKINSATLWFLSNITGLRISFARWTRSYTLMIPSVPSTKFNEHRGDYPE